MTATYKPEYPRSAAIEAQIAPSSRLRPRA